MTTNEVRLAQDVDTLAADRLVSALRILRADIARLPEATSRAAGAEVARGCAKGRDALTSVLAQVTDTQDAVMARAQLAGRAADGYVRANAWQMIGWGSVAGFLLGALVARRGTVAS